MMQYIIASYSKLFADRDVSSTKLVYDKPVSPVVLKSAYMLANSENTPSNEAELGDIAKMMRAALRHSLIDVFEASLQKANTCAENKATSS